MNKAELVSRLLALQPALAASETLRERVAADYIARHVKKRISDQGVTFDCEDERGLFMPWWHVQWLVKEYER